MWKGFLDAMRFWFRFNWKCSGGEIGLKKRQPCLGVGPRGSRGIHAEDFLTALMPDVAATHLRFGATVMAADFDLDSEIFLETVDGTVQDVHGRDMGIFGPSPRRCGGRMARVRCVLGLTGRGTCFQTPRRESRAGRLRSSHPSPRIPLSSVLSGLAVSSSRPLIGLNICPLKSWPSPRTRRRTGRLRDVSRQFHSRCRSCSSPDAILVHQPHRAGS